MLCTQNYYSNGLKNSQHGKDSAPGASKAAAISLRLQGKLSFPYNCQKMNGQIYVLLC